MVQPTGAMDVAALDAYLEEATIPIRLATRTPGGGLWMVSLWFAYDGDAFHCATGADATVVEYLEANDDVAFEVSDNDPPYRGVRGAGTAELAPDPEKTQLRALIERYLGGTDSSLAASLLDGDRQEVRITIEPAKLYTWDFSERMDDAVEG
jgi:nitroimidazol reductase NimA-like FMN-containing flavoprotein (pyridoxamine 5'-phosphate oxidase superfamily)